MSRIACSTGRSVNGSSKRKHSSRARKAPCLSSSKTGALVTSVRGFVGAHALLGPACDRSEGLVRAAEGHRDAALGPLRRSVEAFDRLGARYEAARTREAMASISSTENRRELLLDALECYQEIGARRDADRVGPL